MEILDQYLELQQQIFDYFGYQESWKIIPLDDCRDKYWPLDGKGPGTLCYADTLKALESQTGNYYEDNIYTQRFLSKWVYREPEYTLVCCDPHCDDNKFLRILDNTKEVKT